MGFSKNKSKQKIKIAVKFSNIETKLKPKTSKVNLASEINTKAKTKWLISFTIKKSKE